MRPLVVLLLVLASLAALVVALTTLSDSGRHGDTGRGVEVDATPDRAAPASELAEPGAVPAAANRTESTGPDTRHSVQGPRNASGPKVAFGGIQGKVVDEDGVAIAQAKVFLFDIKPSSLGEDVYLLRDGDPPKPLFKAETDAEGQFVFDGLDPRKDWSLSVKHDAYEEWASEISIPVPEGSHYPETIVMKPGQTLSGVVRDAATQKPIAGVTLAAENPWALTRPKHKRKQTRLEVVTDANGAYVFKNLGASPAQNRVLTITAPGYATQVHNNFMMVAFSQPGNRIKGNKQEQPKRVGRVQDFDLQPGHVIAGRVVGPDQAGMPGIEIEALNQTGEVGSTANATSGKNGEFLLEGLAQGMYVLRVTATNYDAAPLQRVETGNTNVVIELFELAVVSGRVVDEEGQPISSFVVKARATNEMSPAYGAVMAQKSVKDADGRFELTGVPEGSYVIEGVVEGYASCFSDPFTATQGLVASDVIVRMNHGGSLRGQVLDAYSSAPIAGAQVATYENDYIDTQFWDLFGELEPSAMTKAKVFTDEQGRFAVDVMTPGTYQVQITARGASPAYVKDVEIVEGRVTELPPQTLIKGASIVGIVYGRDASVCSGSTIQLNPADLNETMGARQTRSDGTGRFTLDNVQPGTYTLSATRPNGGQGNPFEALADMKQSEMNLSIEDGGTYQIELYLGAKPR